MIKLFNLGTLPYKLSIPLVAYISIHTYKEYYIHIYREFADLSLAVWVLGSMCRVLCVVHLIYPLQTLFLEAYIVIITIFSNRYHTA